MGLVNVSLMPPIGGHSYPSLARNVLPTSVFTQRGNSTKFESLARNTLTTISTKDAPAPSMLWKMTHPESWSETTKAMVYAIFLAIQIGQECIEFSQRFGQPSIFGNRAESKVSVPVPVNLRRTASSVSIPQMVLIGGLTALPLTIGERFVRFDDKVVEVMPIPENVMSAQTNIVNVKAVFTGEVQDVGFRFSTKHWADQLNLAGTVRNMPDGTVEAYIRGPKEKIDWLFIILQEQVFPGHVTNLEIEPADLPDTTEFTIVR